MGLECSPESEVGGTMMKKEKCTAIVLAAGSGKRMGIKTQKLYLNIKGKPVLYYALKCFENSAVIDEIILVTSQAELEYCQREFADQYHFSKIAKIVIGGKERFHSVYEGLKACRDCDYVFIHDGARPFVDEQMLERLFEEVKQSHACVAAMPSKDTVKIVGDDKTVIETPDRKYVWNVQTPQVFVHELVYRAHEKLVEQEGLNATDDAMAVEMMEHHPIKVVEGSYYNIKITTPEDMVLAESYAEKLWGEKI